MVDFKFAPCGKHRSSQVKSLNSISNVEQGMMHVKVYHIKNTS